MSINNIFAFTFVAILGVLQHGRLCAGEHLTVQQSLGLWYNIAVTLPAANTEYKIFSNVTLNVSRSHHDKNAVTITYHQIIDGKPNTEEGHGKIVGSELHVTFPDRTNPKSIYAVTTYNNGKEVIFESKTNKVLNILLSRTTSISDEALAAFEELATKVHATVVFISHVG